MRFVDSDGMAVTIYQPNERQGGFIWGIRQAFSDIHASRHVIIRLFLRDFVAQFRQKLLGYLWALLGPLLSIISFLFLYVAGVLQPGEGDMPYTLYVLLGSSIWGCLPGAMGAVSGGLQAQADLIMRTRIPKIALAVSSLANLCYSIMVGMITTLIVFLFCGIVPTWWFLLYPLLILPMILIGLSIGMVLAVLGTIAKDLTPLATQGLALLMFVTPVVYLRSAIGNPIIQSLITYNPLTYLIDVPRALLVTGRAENVGVYLMVAAGSVVLAIIGIRIFYLLEDLVAERL
ncbi:MAG: ABC transporter permease [Desulfovibrionaceae bacterium]|nr:ABC transporter permease [Desulfovibrionaceae bacterium]